MLEGQLKTLFARLAAPVELACILMVFGCPLGTVTYTIAQQMDSDAELAGEQVIFSTLFSCLTLFIQIFVLSQFGLI